jgi:hypothetical protein
LHHPLLVPFSRNNKKFEMVSESTSEVETIIVGFILEELRLSVISRVDAQFRPSRIGSGSAGSQVGDSLLPL